MITEADDTARKVYNAMVAENTRRAEYFQSGEVHKYWLKDNILVGPIWGGGGGAACHRGPTYSGQLALCCNVKL